MRRVCVVQARTGSTRLPGKVLLDLAGQPMLVQQLRRLARCQSLDEVVVATTSHPDDDVVATIVRGMGLRVVRGSVTDVLGRFLLAARETEADVIVRATADCPLIDPEITDRVVHGLTDDPNGCDYSANVLRRTYPSGLDVEAFHTDTLMRIDRLARTQEEREHVTLTVRVHRPKLFLTTSVEDGVDNSDLRWTVDEERDIRLVRILYDELDLGQSVVPYDSIVRHVRINPHLTSINAGIPDAWAELGKSDGRIIAAG